MRKITLSLAITAAILMNTKAGAQMPYNVSVSQLAYTPLSNTATDITNGQAWSDTASFTFPTGFNFQWGGNSINAISLQDANLILPSLSGTQSGFAILGTSLEDRNYQAGAGKSPIRYETTGVAGSRIFKMEIRNAGFSYERSIYDTSNDSVSIQLWIYENKSTIEFHFGPSSITHFDDYFLGKVPLGYMKNMNTDNFSFEKYYVLKGDPLNPGMDTLTNLNTITGLTSYPASGTVYRFSLKSNTTAISNTEKLQAGKIYPVPTHNVLYVESMANAYEIINLSGNVLASGKTERGRTEIPLQSLAPGLYLIRLSDQKGQTDVQKFIKQ